MNANKNVILRWLLLWTLAGVLITVLPAIGLAQSINLLLSQSLTALPKPLDMAIADSEGSLVGSTWTISNVTSSHTVTIRFERTAANPYDTLRTLVRGCITKSGIINSLIAKINNIEAAEKRGDLKAKAGLIGAFINEVNAQTGKSIDSACAAELIARAQNL